MPVVELPFRCIVSRSLSLSESALAFDEEIRTLRRDTVGELSLEFVSGALLSMLVKPGDERSTRVAQRQCNLTGLTVGYSFRRCFQVQATEFRFPCFLIEILTFALV